MIRTDDIINRSFNGVNYFQMAMNFISESLFDDQLNEMDSNYVLGVLMILVQYFYSMYLKILCCILMESNFFCIVL